MENEDRELIEELIGQAVGRVFRDRTNPLDVLDDNSFRQRFRLTRSAFQRVLALVDDDLSPSTARSRSVSSALKLAIFLETIGSSSLQRVTGITLGCSQATTSRIIAEVSDVFHRRMEEFVVWPDERERELMSVRFMKHCGIPGIVGALDGTHVKILAPSVDEESYVNRKSFHSINVGAICDMDRKFIWASVNFPGRAHDSRVFRSSSLYEKLKAGAVRGVVLADSAYQQEQFLLKPILHDTRTEAEARFTAALCKGRVVVEHGFGCLKRQFQSLHTELRHKPTRACKIIASAICLRNLCILLNEAEFEATEVEEPDHLEAGDTATEAHHGGRSNLQQHIINQYFGGP